MLCLLFHFPCLLSGENLVSVVFYSDCCLASFLLFKSLLPMISFSFSYIKFEIYQNNTTYTLYHAARQVSMFFISLFIILSFLTDIALYYSNPIQLAIRFVSLNRLFEKPTNCADLISLDLINIHCKLNHLLTEITFTTNFFMWLSQVWWFFYPCLTQKTIMI